MVEESTGEPLYMIEVPKMEFIDYRLKRRDFYAEHAAGWNWDEYFYFLEILAHHQRPKGGRGDQNEWFHKILWKSGWTTWDPLLSIEDDSSVEAAQHAADNNLLREKAFAK